VLSLSNTNALSGSTLDYSSAGTVSFMSLTGANLGGLQGSTNLALTNASGTAVALNVGGNNSSTTYSGALSGGGALNKVGTGTLALSGNSSFTGATIISNGAIRVSNNNGLGATNGGTTVLAGAALELDGGITIGAEALTLSNNGISSGGSLRSISGANTYGGLISLGTGVGVGVDAGSLTLTGGVTNGGGSSFTKLGAGTLVLNSTSTATGILTVSGGTMQLGANGAIVPVALNVTNGTTLDLNGRNATLGASGNLNVYLTGATLKSGAGTISLTTTNVGVTVHTAADANSSTISGNLNLGGVTNTFNVADGAAAEDLVVSAAVSNGGIIKTNTGTLVLSASNNFSGDTVLAQGALALGNASSSPSTLAPIFKPATMACRGPLSVEIVL
jgi:autotransporter-associated beta strand protein